MKKILTLTIAALFIISLLPFSSLASFSEDLDIETKEVFTNVSFSIGFPYFESYYIQRNTNHTWIR